MIKNKKIIAMIIFIVATLMIIGCSNNVEREDNNLAIELKDTNKIEIYHDSHDYFEEDYKPADIVDRDIIDDFLSYIDETIHNSDKELSGLVVENKIIFYDKDNNKKILKYAYSDLDELGYLSYKDKRYYLEYDFFRLLKVSEEYRVEKDNIKEDVAKLFSKYKYTPSFMISSESKNLPSNLKYGYEENIDKIYWSYCMELSKDIGMDFSNLLGKEITTEMYYILEQLGEFANPYKEARAIVIRYDDKIVGSYIQGNSNDMVATLEGKSFEEIKNVKMHEWVYKNVLDENSELYKKSSIMSDEDLIKTYFESMEKKDYEAILSTMDMKSIIYAINMNLDSKKLFTENIEDSLPSYINKVNIIDIKKSKYNEENYDVCLDIDVSNDDTIEGGKQVRTIFMTEEDGIKKISEDVTGPQ